MRDESLLIEPDMITYSMIMKEYFSSGDLDKGVFCSNRWKKKAVSPG